MNEDGSDRSVLEERLAAVKKTMERGLPERARALRAAADRLAEGHGSARVDLKRLAHKLRGIVGTFGYEQLSGMAAALEGNALNERASKVVSLAREIAALAEKAAAASARAEGKKQQGGARVGRTRAALRPAREAAVPAGKARSRLRSPVAAVEPAPARASLAAPDPKPDGARRPEQNAGSPIRVLVVDDEQSDRTLLELTLGKLGGFEATVVDSPVKALELLNSELFDLIVVDAMMPELNGMQFVRSARKSSRTAGLPIVILSAASPDELGWDMQNESPAAWLRKPFVPRELVEQLRRILDRE